MRKRMGYILIIVFCLLLTACKSVETNVEMNEGSEKEEETVATKYDEIELTEAADTVELYTAYKNVVLDLYKNKYLLGHEDLSEVMMGRDMSEDKFTVADIDADGQDELIVYFLTAAVAWHIGVVYDYNEETGECYIKFEDYPLLSFYENGAIEAGWSHNQGYAGDFWPYTLYEYDQENDKYKGAGFVDAYDRALYEHNRDSLVNRPFPYDIDKDENGFVYFIYSYDNGLLDYDKIEAVDDDVYQEWLQRYTEGADKIDLTFYSLTEENISQMD